MKHMYRVTRPAWTAKESLETVLIFGVSLVLAIYAAAGERCANAVLSHFHIQSQALHLVWPIVELVVVTSGCLWLVRFYKKRRISCYPATFIYGFIMPEQSNPNGKSQVVGYCHLKPDMETGEVRVEGASFFWEGGELKQRTGFSSSFVRGILKEECTVCEIQFDINEEDRPKRHYSHGKLMFQLVRPRVKNQLNDGYAGYLESYNKKSELQTLVVRARGYAEWNSRGCVAEEVVKGALQQKGSFLFAELEHHLSLTPHPRLWIENVSMPSEKANIWKHDIPTPQSVVLDDRIRPFIERYVASVLSWCGLDGVAIGRFWTSAIQMAKRDETLVGYEHELKAGLIGVGFNEDKAVYERARIIHSEIKGYLVGDSLLDIGCGNGLVSSFAKPDFKRIQLADVVEHVPPGLGLPFKRYAEGDPLPITEQYDTVLLLTVLHHAIAPVELLKLAWSAAKQRLIIIESVVGVHNPPQGVRYELAHCDNESQIAFAAFVDWFYNRVLHDDVPVPFNFTTIENWQATFLQHGMRLINTIHLGQDIEIGPEYHVLFVLEKESSYEVAIPDMNHSAKEAGG